MGDYGHERNIEEAFKYGKQAICFQSDYAALRLGEYCMEHQPEDYGKVLYYLERAYDLGGKGGDRAKILLRKYLEEKEIPEYMKSVYPDFLKVSEEKWQKEMECAEY